MPAATTKAALTEVALKEYAKLRTLIDPIPESVALAPHEDGITIKDTVGHRAYWIDLFLGWWADGQGGRPVHAPAEGYGWNDLKALNARIREDQAGLGWDAARDLLADRHAALMALLEALDDAALYGGPMKGGNGKWTAGRYAEAAGPSHYRSAAKFIRACLREGG